MTRDGDPPQVTVVVSTYNRPDALSIALGTLQRQAGCSWMAWVIGDCCDARTAAVVSAQEDPRIRYVNLPERWGDQSGPNSVGAFLVRTPYLAFLNHDDLWLPDHLAVAVGCLERTGADFCLGRSFSVRRWDGPPDALRIGLVEGPSGRQALWRAYADADRFEPASTWVLRSEAFRTVGDWRNGFDLYRTPVADWVMRAWRAKLRVVEPPVATAVRVFAHWPANAGPRPLQYDQPVTAMRAVAEGLALRSADEGRVWLDGQVTPWASEGLARTRQRRNLHRFAAYLHLATGFDAYAWWCRLRGRPPGHHKRRLLRERVVEPADARPDLDRLKACALSQAAEADGR